MSTNADGTGPKASGGHLFRPVAWVVVNSYLDAVRERVVIFDGATGTNLQLRQLGPDDFGGAGARGLQRGARATPAPT